MYLYMYLDACVHMYMYSYTYIILCIGIHTLHVNMDVRSTDCIYICDEITF